MEKESDMSDIIASLSKHAEKINKRRQELQEDEGLLKRVISRLSSGHFSVNCGTTSVWSEKEEIMKSYQKAREDRDEYRFQLNVCKNEIKELKNALATARLNQTQLNSSIISNTAHTNEMKTSDCNCKQESADSNIAGGGQYTINTPSSEALKRENDYLHKTNEEFLGKIRKLKSDLAVQNELKEKLQNYEKEIANLKRINEDKQTKMMEMRFKFDELLKNTKREPSCNVTHLKHKNTELQEEKDALQLKEAHQEICLLKHIPIKKSADKAAEHNISTMCFENDLTGSEQMNGTAEKETSSENEKLLNVRRERRGQLKPIENIMESQHPSFESVSEQLSVEEQQVSLDEVKDVDEGATKGMKRGQKGDKGSKKDRAAAQKQEAEKVSGFRAAVNSKRKAKDSRKDTTKKNNKQNKQLVSVQETDENVKPDSLESSSSSVFSASGKIKFTEDTSTPNRKPQTKVQDDKKRTTRRRNK